jgi:hypothetical protein
MRYPFIAALAAFLASSSLIARADDRPTSGDMSVISGRTLGNGETALAGGVGWPGLWAQATFAPSSTFNLGFRGSVLYGSPFMGFNAGIGGEVAVPVRLWLFGSGSLDVSLFLEPGVVVAEGSLVGQQGAFQNDLGLAGYGTFAALSGAQLSDALTLVLGLGGNVAYVVVPDASGGDLVGAVLAIAGIEALVSRDTLLFLELRGGVGFKPDLLFGGQEAVRGSIGIAYQL